MNGKVVVEEEEGEEDDNNGIEMFPGEQIIVECCDGKTRAAILCGAMRKRKFINQGQIVLVSIREWQDDICDIIDSYEDSHAKRLKSEKETR